MSCSYMNCSCNYMLQTDYIKFTRIFHTGYIIYIYRLHAACRTNVIQHVIAYPPISESRGVRHYMRLPELYITFPWSLHSACIWYVKNSVILCKCPLHHILHEKTHYIEITFILHLLHILHI